MKLTIKGNDWVNKPVQVSDRTKTILKNGKKIDSASSMLRQAYKTGR
jgi:hypothetical protein